MSLSQRPRTIADLEMWMAMGERRAAARTVHDLSALGVSVEDIAASRAGYTEDQVRKILSRPAPA